MKIYLEAKKHKPYIVAVGLYARKIMYTIDHTDSSDGSIINEIIAQIHKHHPTFYSASFQQYEIFGSKVP